MNDLDAIATFVRVAEARSFSAAARALGVPTSTVSRTVTRLEAELGVRLVQRTTRAVSLTRDGEHLHRRVAGPLSDLGAALTEVREAGSVPRGVLRVTAPSDMAPLFGEIVAGFTERHPQVHVDAVLTSRRVDLVAEGFDIALRGTATPDPSHVARKLFDSSPRFYAASSYLARNPAPRDPSELARHDLVSFREKRQTLVVRNGEREVRVDVEARIVADHFGLVLGATRAGAGIGALPGVLACDDLTRGRLVPVLPGWELPRAAAWLVYPAGRKVAPKVAAFRDYVIETFRDLEAAEARETAARSRA